MDKDHQLDAPHNESLRGIEQLGDRSELSAVYPHPHKEWEESNMLSSDDRDRKHLKEREIITTSVRKSFIAIGLLTPVPFIVFVCFSAALSAVATKDNLGFLLLPIIIGLGLWVLVSYLALRRVHTIFYSHALRTVPFLATLLCLLAMCAQTLYSVTRPMQVNSFMVNSLALSGLLLIASVILSGILLFIWTSPRLHPSAKVSYMALLSVLLLGLAVAVTVL